MVEMFIVHNKFIMFIARINSVSDNKKKHVCVRSAYTLEARTILIQRINIS